MIEDRISCLSDGKAFVPSDFLDITSSVNINNILTRLVSEGMIRRCFRGVYNKPYFSSALGVELMPKPDEVIAAIARKNGWEIAPAGQTALNRIGLSTQIPVTLEYVTSGPSKSYEYDGFSISMRHRANRDMIGNSPVTKTFPQALKALGKNSIDESVLDSLASKLSREQVETIYQETKTATSWVYEAAKGLKERQHDRAGTK